MKQGVITKLTALLNPQKIGYSTTGIVLVKTDPGMFEEAASRISNLPETYHALQTTGEYNIFAVVHTHKLEQLSELRNKVETILGVKEVTVSATVRLIKIKTTFKL